MASFANQLEFTGKALTAGGAGAPVRELRNLKDDHLPEYLSRNTRHEIRSLSFLLMILLDDIFYNFSGDFPYEDPYGEEVDALRVDFFTSVGSTLTELAKVISENQFSAAFQSLTSLTVNYLDCLAKINDRIEESLRGLKGRGGA